MVTLTDEDLAREPELQLLCKFCLNREHSNHYQLTCRWCRREAPCCLECRDRARRGAVMLCSFECEDDYDRQVVFERNIADDEDEDEDEDEDAGDKPVNKYANYLRAAPVGRLDRVAVYNKAVAILAAETEAARAAEAAEIEAADIEASDDEDL